MARTGTPKFQVAHRFLRGQPVVRAGGQYVLATTSSGYDGVVGSVSSRDQFELVTAGELDNVPGLTGTDGQVWYLSDTPGVLSPAGTFPALKSTGKTVVVIARSAATSGAPSTYTLPEPLARDRFIGNVSMTAPRGLFDVIEGLSGTWTGAITASEVYGTSKVRGGIVSGGEVHADDGLTADVQLVTDYDPMTGEIKYGSIRFRDGVALATSDFGWGRHREELPAAESGILAPSLTAPPESTASIYRHVSDALTWRDNSENKLLYYKTLSPVTVYTSVPWSASVTVQSNAGDTWYGTVIPLEFRNQDNAPRGWVVQLSAPTGIPSLHKVMFSLSNKANCEQGFLLDIPDTKSFQVKHADDSWVVPVDGVMKVWLFLGLGRVPAGKPVASTFGIQIDVWMTEDV